MRAILYATLARAEIAAKLTPVLGSELKTVDTDEQLVAEIADADALFIGDMLYTPAVAEALRTKGKKLKWMQVLTAGYEHAQRLGVPGGVTVTNMGDALAPAVGLHAVTLMLALQRHIPTFLKNQPKHAWDRAAARHLASPHGMVAAVLGFGHIGREIGRILQALGAHVIGVSRSGDAREHADETAPLSKLDEVLKRADAVMIALALEPATHHLINARTLALCKPSALLVNIARGGIVDSNALAEALEKGTIAGAGIDVTDPEPLPADHKLWDAPNLILSPHCAGAAGNLTTDRISGVAADNLQRYRRGEALKNVITL